MDTLYFYGKPGCVGNQRQQALLRTQGIAFQVKDLLTIPWTAAILRPFFGDKPVASWFNTSAPQIKSGALDIHALDEAQALALMVVEPLLIGRPLLEYGKLRQSGFSAGPVLDALGVSLESGQDLQSCPLHTEPEAML